MVEHATTRRHLREDPHGHAHNTLDGTAGGNRGRIRRMLGGHGDSDRCTDFRTHTYSNSGDAHRCI